MNKKILLLMFFLTKSLSAIPGPTVECRFGALNNNERFDFDESVTYVLAPGTGVSGSFDPYWIDISAYHGDLSIEIYLGDDLVSEIQVPIPNIVVLPFGASVFGVNTVYHESLDGFISMRYECLRVMP